MSSICECSTVLLLFNKIIFLLESSLNFICFDFNNHLAVHLASSCSTVLSTKSKEMQKYY